MRDLDERLAIVARSSLAGIGQQAADYHIAVLWIQFHDWGARSRRLLPFLTARSTSSTGLVVGCS
jgi:hypothetical protein